MCFVIFSRRMNDWAQNSPIAPDVDVDVVPTPNQDAVKLMPGCDVTGQVRSIYIRSGDLEEHDDGPNSPALSRLGARLLRIEGVKSLLFGYDFITIERHPTADWDAIQACFVVHDVESAKSVACAHGFLISIFLYFRTRPC